MGAADARAGVRPGPDAPVVGIVGGGQLARMTAPAAAALGVRLRVLAGSAGDSAAQVIPDAVIGDPDDAAVVLAFARGCDVLTFDHEHVPPSVLADVEAAGCAVRPGPFALAHAQDKAHMRAALGHLPMPRWSVVQGPDDLAEFAASAGWPVIVKTSRGGYDGRGVWRIESPEQAREVLARKLPTGAVWLAEECVPFAMEICAQVARSPQGQAVAYPVVRTLQVDGMCAEVVAPCPDLPEADALRAQQIALDVAATLEVTGMLAVEMFWTPEGPLINELAMRPHNSGHWTIDGAVTSQFENHLRAVLDLPLGSPAMLAPYAVMANVIGPDDPDVPALYAGLRHVLARDPAARVEIYGKELRPRRKVGHVNVIGSDLHALLQRAHHAADYLGGVIDE